MGKQEKKLLVEGETDRVFFEACLTKVKLADQVWVGPPIDFSSRK